MLARLCSPPAVRTVKAVLREEYWQSIKATRLRWPVVVLSLQQLWMASRVWWVATQPDVIGSTSAGELIRRGLLELFSRYEEGLDYVNRVESPGRDHLDKPMSKPSVKKVGRIRWSRRPMGQDQQGLVGCSKAGHSCVLAGEKIRTFFVACRCQQTKREGPSMEASARRKVLTDFESFRDRSKPQLTQAPYEERVEQ